MSHLKNNAFITLIHKPNMFSRHPRDKLRVSKRPLLMRQLCSLCRHSTGSLWPTPNTSARLSSARRATAADDQTRCEYHPPALYALQGSSTLKGNFYFSCGCPINVDGNFSQLEQKISQFVLYWQRKLSFLSLSCSHSCSCSAYMCQDALQTLISVQSTITAQARVARLMTCRALFK